jgi:outer membrane protein W
MGHLSINFGVKLFERVYAALGFQRSMNMKIVRLIAVLCLIIPIVSVSTDAQSLERRHQIGLRAGIRNQVTNVRTEIGVGGVSTSVENSGSAGALTYAHWLQQNLALDIAFGGMAVDVETRAGAGGVSTSTAVVGHILLGFRYHFLKSTYNSTVRPFVGAGVGPFVGSQSQTDVGSVITVESRSEMALGGELTTGVDFLLSRLFIASVTVGYVLVTDFNEPIGGSKNYSGPEFMMGIGLLLGKGRSQIDG